jgi:Tol biopolymer transport system component
MQTLTEGLFNNIELAFSIRPIHWVVQEQIVIALANEGELYRWLLWSPFEDSREILEVELEGLGNALERYHTDVSFDPFLEYVIYPCEDCPPAEYLVKNMRSDETEWSIDLGEKPGSAYRGFPYWSPDGQYIAIVSGDFEQTTWIFNRRGEVVHRIEGGTLNMSWSPGSRYLAFGRDNENPLNGENYSVTLLDLADNTLIDLCVNPYPPSVPIYWSWDSSKIAFGNRVSELDNPKTSIYIVDINSGDKVELSNEEEDYRIEGWVNIDSTEP